MRSILICFNLALLSCIGLFLLPTAASDSLAKNSNRVIEFAEGYHPRVQPGKNPRDQPGKNPRDQPGKNPRVQPGKNPRDQPGKNPRVQPGKELEFGAANVFPEFHQTRRDRRKRLTWYAKTWDQHADNDNSGIDHVDVTLPSQQARQTPANSGATSASGQRQQAGHQGQQGRGRGRPILGGRRG